MPDSQLLLLHRLQEKIRTHRACRGYGYVLKDGQKTRCGCRTEALYQYRLARSGIPPKYRTKGFKDYVYKESDAYKKMQSYLKQAKEHQEQGMGLLLHGPNYTGKSLLACSLLMELMKRDYDCKFLYFGNLLGVKKGSDTLIPEEFDFLCIDGMSEVLENLTNFREGALSGVQIHGAVEFAVRAITMRIHESKPIIMTSTQPLTVINQKFPNLAGALIGNCLHVSCEDKGFRQRKLEQMMEGDG